MTIGSELYRAIVPLTITVCFVSVMFCCAVFVLRTCRRFADIWTARARHKCGFVADTLYVPNVCPHCGERDREWREVIAKQHPLSGWHIKEVRNRHE